MVDSCRFCHIQSDSALPVARSCANDNQISVLPSPRYRIQGRKSRRNTGEAIRLLNPLEPVKCSIQCVSKINIVTLQVALHCLEDLRLRLFDELVYLVSLVKCLL